MEWQLGIGIAAAVVVGLVLVVLVVTSVSGPSKQSSSGLPSGMELKKNFECVGIPQLPGQPIDIKTPVDAAVACSKNPGCKSFNVNMGMKKAWLSGESFVDASNAKKCTFANESATAWFGYKG